MFFYFFYFFNILHCISCFNPRTSRLALCKDRISNFPTVDALNSPVLYFQMASGSIHQALNQLVQIGRWFSHELQLLRLNTMRNYSYKVEMICFNQVFLTFFFLNFLCHMSYMSYILKEYHQLNHC